MGAWADRHDRLEEWLVPFRTLFTRPTWRRLLVLAAGAILTTHRRTVTAALRVMGRGEDKGFSRYHDVLSRSRWSALAAARLLLAWLVSTFVPAGRVVIGLDDTIERRWGAKIAGRGVKSLPKLTPFRVECWPLPVEAGRDMPRAPIGALGMSRRGAWDDGVEISFGS